MSVVLLFFIPSNDSCHSLPPTFLTKQDFRRLLESAKKVANHQTPEQIIKVAFNL